MICYWCCCHFCSSSLFIIICKCYSSACCIMFFLFLLLALLFLVFWFVFWFLLHAFLYTLFFFILLLQCCLLGLLTAQITKKSARENERARAQDLLCDCVGDGYPAMPVATSLRCRWKPERRVDKGQQRPKGHSPDVMLDGDAQKQGEGSQRWLYKIGTSIAMHENCQVHGCELRFSDVVHEGAMIWWQLQAGRKSFFPLSAIAAMSLSSRGSCRASLRLSPWSTHAFLLGGSKRMSMKAPHCGGVDRVLACTTHLLAWHQVTRQHTVHTSMEVMTLVLTYPDAGGGGGGGRGTWIS